MTKDPKRNEFDAISSRYAKANQLMTALVKSRDLAKELLAEGVDNADILQTSVGAALFDAKVLLELLMKNEGKVP